MSNRTPKGRHRSMGAITANDETWDQIEAAEAITRLEGYDLPRARVVALLIKVGLETIQRRRGDTLSTGVPAK